MKLKKHPSEDDLRHLRKEQHHLLRYWKTLVPVKQAQLLYLRDKLMLGKELINVGGMSTFLLVVSVAYYIETHRDCSERIEK